MGLGKIQRCFQRNRLQYEIGWGNYGNWAHFRRSYSKGLRMIGLGMHGFVENKELKIDDIDKALHEPTDQRIFVISKAFRKGYTVDQIHELTKIDKWFLYKLCHIIEIAEELEKLTPSRLIFKRQESGFR